MPDDPFSPYPAPTSVSGKSPFPPAEPEPPQPKQEVSQPVEDLTRKFVSAQKFAAAHTPVPTPTSAQEESAQEESAQELMDEEEVIEQRALKTVAGIIIVLIAVFIIGGSSAWYFLARDTDDAEPSPQSTGNLIVAEEGGEVSSGYGASVIIPPGALAGDAEITISRVALGDVTDRFELKPHGLEFSKPVKVLIPYKESGFTADKTAQDIRLKYWSDDPDFKRENLSYTINSEDKILSAEVMHF